MSNAVGQASQLIVVQVLPGGASPAAPANGLPRAVQVTITMVRQGRTETMPPLTVALKAAVQ